MTSVRLTNLADHLRAAGLTVIEHNGWKSRGKPLPGRPDTILCHHTAGPARGDLPTLKILVEGRSDLPGPLCQIALSRSGVVYMIASGKANHAGRGEWKGQAASGLTIGIEAENPGDGKAWPVKQLDAYERLCAALCRYLNVGAERVCGHREWALPKGRKTDPAGIDMNAFRDRVRGHLAGAPSDEEDDDMKPEDFARIEQMMDDKLRIVLRAQTRDGKDTGHPNLRDISARLDALHKLITEQK